MIGGGGASPHRRWRGWRRVLATLGGVCGAGDGAASTAVAAGTLLPMEVAARSRCGGASFAAGACGGGVSRLARPAGVGAVGVVAVEGVVGAGGVAPGFGVAGAAVKAGGGEGVACFVAGDALGLAPVRVPGDVAGGDVRLAELLARRQCLLLAATAAPASPAAVVPAEVALVFPREEVRRRAHSVPAGSGSEGWLPSARPTAAAPVQAQQELALALARPILMTRQGEVVLPSARWSEFDRLAV